MALYSGAAMIGDSKQYGCRLAIPPVNDRQTRCTSNNSLTLQLAGRLLVTEAGIDEPLYRQLQQILIRILTLRNDGCSTTSLRFTLFKTNYYKIVSKYSLYWIVIVTRLSVCVNSVSERICYLTQEAALSYGYNGIFLKSRVWPTRYELLTPVQTTPNFDLSPQSVIIPSDFLMASAGATNAIKVTCV